METLVLAVCNQYCPERTRWNRFHAQVHDSVRNNIAVFANKTLLEILLVGLNIYSNKGEHSIAYTDLKKYIENRETGDQAITSLITSVAAVQMRLLIFCL